MIAGSGVMRAARIAVPGLPTGTSVVPASRCRWALAGVLLAATTGLAGFAAPSRAADVPGALKLLARAEPQSIARAAAIFEEALAANPKDTPARMGLVYARLLGYLTTGKKEAPLLADALGNVDLVLKTDPRHEEAWIKRSQILFFLGRPDEGLEALRAGLRQAPESLELHEALLVYLLNLGRFGEAVVFSRRPEPPVKEPHALQLRFGRVWLRAGRPQEARESFLAANRAHPSREASAGVTRALIAEGEASAAIANLLGHLKAYPEDLEAQQDLGFLYEEQGDRIKARLCWTKIRAQAKDPALQELVSEHIRRLAASE